MPPSTTSVKRLKNSEYEIRDVYEFNLEQEFKEIRTAILTHRFVAFDVEYPGVVVRPIPASDILYDTVKANVDMLSPIQLSFCLTDEYGRFYQAALDKKPIAAWNFNFKFSLKDDMYAAESIDLLERAGLNFENHARFGVDPLHFGELLTSSGLILDDSVTFVSFHSSYPLAYLLKLVTCTDLPTTTEQFYDVLTTYLPKSLDIRATIFRIKNTWTGGLDTLARDLGLERFAGPPHQAASDAVLASQVFFAFRQKYGTSNEINSIVYGIRTVSTVKENFIATNNRSGISSGGGLNVLTNGMGEEDGVGFDEPSSAHAAVT